LASVEKVNIAEKLSHEMTVTELDRI